MKNSTKIPLFLFVSALIVLALQTTPVWSAAYQYITRGKLVTDLDADNKKILKVAGFTIGSGGQVCEPGQTTIFDGSGNVVCGASGDSSFKIQGRGTTADDYVQVKGGTGEYQTSKRLITSLGTNDVLGDGIGVDLEFQLAANECDGTTAKATSTDYLVYVVLEGLSLAFVEKSAGNDTLVEAYKVPASAFCYTSDKADAPESTHYLVGWIATDGSGNVSTASNSFGSLQIRSSASWANVKLVNHGDWTDYTPTGSWSGTYDGAYKRIGDEIIVRAEIVLDGAQSGNPTFTLPSGLTWDTAKWVGQGITYPLGECGYYDDTATLTYPARAYWKDADEVYAHFWDSLGGNFIKATQVSSSAPFGGAASDVLACTFRGPITGWTTDTGALATPNNTESVRVTSAGAAGGCATGYSEISTTFDATTNGIQIDYFDNSFDGGKLLKNVQRPSYVDTASTICVDWDSADFASSDYAEIRLAAGPTVTALPIESGTYTPTVTNCVNLDGTCDGVAVTCTNPLYYQRVVDVVKIGGSCNIDITSAGAQTDFELSLPIASDLAGIQDGWGVVLSRNNAGDQFAVAGTASDTLIVRGKPQTTNDIDYQFTLFYRIK